MTFDWHMLYPLHTVILDNSQVFGGVPCKAQLCNFSKWFFSPRFGVVPIWELWQFCYVRIGPPKKATCCAFCAFCAFRYFNSARASGGVCSACYAFCACYLVCACCACCARSTRFQNLTCNTLGHKSAPPARNVQMVDKGVWSGRTQEQVFWLCAAGYAHPFQGAVAGQRK